ncbi:MAG: hypothetical protein BRC38_03755, partial [Cyanobacteria bacterium QH_6_48_35]
MSRCSCCGVSAISVLKTVVMVMDAFRSPPYFSAALIVISISCSEGTGNSLRFLAELTNFTPPVPVVVLTAEESLMDRVEIASLGGQGFLHKPISPKQVLETVTQVLEQSRPAETKVM